MHITLNSNVITGDSITIDEDRVIEIEDLTGRLQADINFVDMSWDEDDASVVADAINRISTRLTEARSMKTELADEGLEYVEGWVVYESLCDAINDAVSVLFDTCIMPGSTPVQFPSLGRSAA